MTTENHTVVMNGFGPNVRFKTKGTNASIQVATNQSVRTVPLDSEGVNLTFHRAA